MAAGRQPTDAVDRYVAKLTRQATTGDDVSIISSLFVTVEI